MKNHVTLLMLLPLLWACQANKMPTRQTAKSKEGVVAAAHPLAAQAGRDMLNQGGNAADAAIASAFALSVVEPSMSGLGGRLQAIIQLPDGSIQGIDATTQSPIAYDTAVFKPKRYGYTTIGIPGVVAGLTKLHEEYGSLPLEVIMAPAVRYAEKGFGLLPGEARRHAALQKELSEFEGSKTYFLRADGSTYPAGSLLIQKDLANTLRTIAAEGRKGFYEGPIAEQMAADIQANGGCVALEDLKNYQALSSRIVNGSYREYDLHGLWLPSFGAITIEILHILENFPVDRLSESDRVALIYQAMQLAYNDRSIQLKSDTIANTLLSKAYAKTKADSIQLDRPNTKLGLLNNPPDSWQASMGHTTHLTTADASGMVVALTQSLGPSMGSKVASPKLGFLYAVTLGSYLRMYKPGQRVSSHISPFLVTKDGKPFLGLGAAGGSRIVTAIAQVVSQVIDEQLPIDQALAASRIYPDQDTLLLETHPGLKWSADVIATLQKEGFHLKSIPDPGRFARVHAVQFNAKKQKWTGAADPDWEGAVGKE